MSSVPRLAFATVRGLSEPRLKALLNGRPDEALPIIAAAARYGLVEAQLLLGQCLLEGRGTSVDAAAAVRWFSAAAEAGCADGMNMLGQCHELGRGVGQSDALAAGWYARAVEQNLDWAQFNLANLVLRGRGVTRDLGKSMVLYRAAADQGHAKSMNMIGRLFEEGWGVPRDLRSAFHWYQRAADGGDARGQYNLASLLVARGSVSEATAWLERAVRDGTQDFLFAVHAALLASEYHGFRVLGAFAAARLGTSARKFSRQEKGAYQEV